MTQSARIWLQIEELMGDAHKCVTVVAPFIKLDVLAATLSAVPASVEVIKCVTRWVPQEVAAGVSDPEIIELAEDDRRLRISLCPTLHAKLYLADDRGLTGSANLTAKATGRATHQNIEILVEVPSAHVEVNRVLTEVNASAIEATPYLASLMRKQADLLTQQRSIANGVFEDRVWHEWYPETRRPEMVYPYYCGRAGVGQSIEGAIIHDLAHLGVPAGLSEKEFVALVESRLRSIPALQALVDGSRLSNVELQRALQEQAGMTNEKAGRIAETIAAWLRHFGDFYTDVGTWEIRHGRELT